MKPWVVHFITKENRNDALIVFAETFEKAMVDVKAREGVKRILG